MLVFWDYDGNGSINSDEKLLENIVIRIDGIECVTKADGTCRLAGVQQGSQTIGISAPQNFKFILPSVSERIQINNGLPIEIINSSIINIPLAEGTVILPFPKSVSYLVNSWYDRAIREQGKVENWMGETDIVEADHWSSRIRVQDNHPAVDYVFSESVPIVASDSATIISIEREHSGNEGFIVEYQTKYGLVFNVGHLNLIEGLHVGQTIYRGELIGYAAARRLPLPNDVKSPFIFHWGMYPEGGDFYSHIDPYFPSIFTTQNFDLARVIDISIKY